MVDRTFTLTFHSEDRIFGTSDDFTIFFNPNLVVDDEQNYEVALTDLGCWYTWRNIEEEYNNTTFYYNNGTTDQSIDIPEGFYGVESLNTFLHAQMKALGDYSAGTGPNGADEYFITLIPNYEINRAQLAISGGYSVDFTQGALNETLGFDAAIYSADVTAQNNPQINNGITNIIVNCDLVKNSLISGRSASSIFTFRPPTEVNPGEFIELHPPNLKWMPLSKNVIEKVRFQIVDNLEWRINFNGEELSITLQIRRIRR